MNKQKKIPRVKGVCPECHIAVNDLTRHIRRNRCVEQGLRHEHLPSGEVMKYGGKQPLKRRKRGE